jgi:hypothetical protein
MGRHRPAFHPKNWVAAILVAALVVATVYIVGNRGDRSGGGNWAEPAASPCARTVRILTAASFAPVLDALSPELNRGADCVRVDTQVVDGRAAATRVGQVDVWIPDDASWKATAAGTRFAPNGTIGSGTTLATSPLYMVAGRAAADRLDRAGAGWLGLAHLLADGPDTRLVVRDPAGSGDGLVGVGAVGEAVWIAEGMDPSALALSRIRRVTRATTEAAATLPANPDEVGVLPEYALAPVLERAALDTRTFAGADHTALLRYTWLPTAAAAGDPARAAGLERVLSALTGSSGTQAMTAARLRPDAVSTNARQETGESPAGSPPPAATEALPPTTAGTEAPPTTAATEALPPTALIGSLPPTTAVPFDVLGQHHVDHVFATWYAGDRQISLLIVTDVSGSMAEPAAGTGLSRIDLVRQGCTSVGVLLPDDAQLGLWQFGAQLDPPRDYQVLLPMGALTETQRSTWTKAVDGLAAKKTGTGLYDTMIAAYESARDHYQPDVPNQVLLFTDGRNEDAAGSATIQQLSQRLIAEADPKRPVQFTVVTFGQLPDVAALKEALKPVGGYVEALRTPQEVEAAFIHVTAGGLHGG